MYMYIHCVYALVDGVLKDAVTVSCHIASDKEFCSVLSCNNGTIQYNHGQYIGNPPCALSLMIRPALSHRCLLIDGS